MWYLKVEPKPLNGHGSKNVTWIKNEIIKKVGRSVRTKKQEIC